jgi:hypothetical protein
MSEVEIHSIKIILTSCLRIFNPMCLKQNETPLFYKVIKGSLGVILRVLAGQFTFGSAHGEF